MSDKKKDTNSNIIDFRARNSYETEVENMYAAAIKSFYDELEERKQLIQIAKSGAILGLNMMAEEGINPEELFVGDVNFMMSGSMENLNHVLNEELGIPVCVFLNSGKVYSVVIHQSNDEIGVTIIRANEDGGGLEVFSDGEWIVPFSDDDDDDDDDETADEYYEKATELQRLILKRDYFDPERSFFEAMIDIHGSLPDDQYDECKKFYLNMLTMAYDTDASFELTESGDLVLRPGNSIGMVLSEQDGKWKLYHYFKGLDFVEYFDDELDVDKSNLLTEYKRLIGTTEDPELAKIILGGYDSDAIVAPLSFDLGVAVDPSEFDIDNLFEEAKRTARNDLDRDLRPEEIKNLNAFIKWFKKNIFFE